jgi:hypothetical protein
VNSLFSRLVICCTLVSAAVTSLSGETATGLQPDSKTISALSFLADQYKAALARGDMQAANDISLKITSGTATEYRRLQPTPEASLSALEQQPAVTEVNGRLYQLRNILRVAYQANDLQKTELYASEMAALIPQLRNPSDAVHWSNIYLGLHAVSRGDMTMAKQRLLDAGRVKGSPVLNSFGPNMLLAKVLLEKGEKATVLEYFDLVKSFWAGDQGKLADWIAVVRGGGVPAFGPNLMY